MTIYVWKPMQIRILKQFLKSTELQIIEEIYDFSDLDWRISATL